MGKCSKSWQSYEEVSRFLLNEFAEHFNIGKVEGKQIIPGKSGVTWEIDAKGIMIDNDGFIIVECRRYTTSRPDQESIAGLAYRIKDSGAKGGIVVSPLGLQKGAKIIAGHENIHQVILDPKSTTTDYMLKFMNKIFVGVSDKISIKDSVHAQVVRDGKIIQEIKS
jgi:hypothetical protein